MTAQPSAPPQADAGSHVWVRLPRSGRFTHADLEEMPLDTGLRFELVDGTLLVNAAPSTAHQRMVRELFLQLHAACPAGLEAFPVPLNYRPDDRREFGPDLLVVRSDDLQAWGLSAPPLLVVEVRSPSTRLVDQHLKRAAYEEAGVPSYWLVDPLEPSLTVLELVEGGYRELARTSGEQVYDAAAPFPVRIRLR